MGRILTASEVSLVLAQGDAHIAAASKLWRDCELEAGRDPHSFGEMTTWFVEHEEQIVGAVGLHGIDWIARRARAATYISPPWRRKGLASQAIRERNRMAFEQLNLNKIEVAVRADRLGTLALLGKLNARQEGICHASVYACGRYFDSVQFYWAREV